MKFDFHCPNQSCRGLPGAISGVNAEGDVIPGGEAPQPGDISLCEHCGQWARINEQGSLDPLTLEEVVAQGSPDQQEWARGCDEIVHEMIRERKAN